MGAIDAWGWEWYWAVLLFFGGMRVMLIAGGGAALAGLYEFFQRAK